MGMTKSQVLKEVLNHIEIREGVLKDFKVHVLDNGVGDGL